MMSQHEAAEVRQEYGDPLYGSYEGQQAASTHQHYEHSYEQNMREGSSGKVYPLSRERTNILRFTLALISLGMLLLFGLLFVVVIGGTVGWASFAVACFALFAITGIGIVSLKER